MLFTVESTKHRETCLCCPVPVGSDVPTLGVIKMEEEVLCLGDLSHTEKVHVTCSCVVEAAHLAPSISPCLMQIFLVP